MLMELDRFWEIIGESRRDFSPQLVDGNMDRQLEVLKEFLSELPVEEVAAFSNTFTKLSLDAYKWDLWAAAYIIDGGCSDDGFTDFRYWLISMGHEVYDKAMANAESLADVAFQPGIECTQFEEFGYVAGEIGRELDSTAYDAGLIDFDHPESPSGLEWKDEDLPIRFPQLVTAEADLGK